MGISQENTVCFMSSLFVVFSLFGVATAALKTARVPEMKNFGQRIHTPHPNCGALWPTACTQVQAGALVFFASVDPVRSCSIAVLLRIFNDLHVLCGWQAAAGDVSWVAPTKAVLGPTLSIFTVLFLMRVVLSWFPKYDLNQLPWNIAAWPTEPILKGTRQVIPPVGGVDISPIVWIAITSFFSEILLGPQGLLTILQKKG